MLTHSEDFNPSTKTSVLSETDESFKLLSRCFWPDLPPSSDLLLQSHFLPLEKVLISRLILNLIATALL